MSDENEGRVSGYLTAAVLGAAVGAGLALLFAPRSGKETRDLLTKKACDLKDKATDAVGEVREMVREKKAEITAAVEAGKQAIQEERAKHSKTV